MNLNKLQFTLTLLLFKYDRYSTKMKNLSKSRVLSFHLYVGETQSRRCKTDNMRKDYRTKKVFKISYCWTEA